MLLIGFVTYAQDMNYSQYFSTPIYYNPAFTGINNGIKVRFLFRDQWPTLPVDFKSYYFSADLGEMTWYLLICWIQSGVYYQTSFIPPDAKKRIVPDFGAGGIVQFTTATGNISGNLGFSVDHIFKPDISFLSAASSQLARKWGEIHI